MTTENKIDIIAKVGAFALGGLIVYAFYKAKMKKPVVDEVLDTTPTPAPTPAPVKKNPFTAMLNTTFPAINFKPTDYSVKNPFADVNTAIADVNPFSSSTNTGERLV